MTLRLREDAEPLRELRLPEAELPDGLRLALRLRELAERGDALRERDREPSEPTSEYERSEPEREERLREPEREEEREEASEPPTCVRDLVR